MVIIRGDTGKFKFQRKDIQGNPITVKADKIYFTVKRNYVNFQPVIQKKIEDMFFDNEGFYHFTILPSETDNLEYGNYYYDIERIVDGDKMTISKGTLKIDKEITFSGNEV